VLSAAVHRAPPGALSGHAQARALPLPLPVSQALAYLRVAQAVIAKGACAIAGPSSSADSVGNSAVTFETLLPDFATTNTAVSRVFSDALAADAEDEALLHPLWTPACAPVAATAPGAGAASLALARGSASAVAVAASLKDSVAPPSARALATAAAAPQLPPGGLYAAGAATVAANDYVEAFLAHTVEQQRLPARAAAATAAAAAAAAAAASASGSSASAGAASAPSLLAARLIAATLALIAAEARAAGAVRTAAVALQQSLLTLEAAQPAAGSNEEAAGGKAATHKAAAASDVSRCADAFVVAQRAAARATGLLSVTRSRFRDFLQSSDQYDVGALLAATDAPAVRARLVAERIILYARLRRHGEVVRMYVSGLNDVPSALRYCAYVADYHQRQVAELYTDAHAQQRLAGLRTGATAGAAAAAAVAAGAAAGASAMNEYSGGGSALDASFSAGSPQSTGGTGAGHGTAAGPPRVPLSLLASPNVHAVLLEALCSEAYRARHPMQPGDVEALAAMDVSEDESDPTSGRGDDDDDDEGEGSDAETASAVAVAAAAAASAAPASASAFVPVRTAAGTVSAAARTVLDVAPQALAEYERRAAVAAAAAAAAAQQQPSRAGSVADRGDSLTLAVGAGASSGDAATAAAATAAAAAAALTHVEYVFDPSARRVMTVSLHPTAAAAAAQSNAASPGGPSWVRSVMGVLSRHWQDLSPLDVLTILPDSFPLRAAVPYLRRAMPASLHHRRTLQVTAALHRMYYLKSKEELQLARQPALVLMPASRCPECMKLIGERTVISVHPVVLLTEPGNTLPPHILSAVVAAKAAHAQADGAHVAAYAAGAQDMGIVVSPDGTYVVMHYKCGKKVAKRVQKNQQQRDFVV
jgi:hypothetical protein